MSYNETYNNYLQHHGILGMHWGKKNGPPYPLGYSEHSSAEKSQNPKSVIDGKASSGSSSSRKSNANSKTSVDPKSDKDYSKYVKIGAAAIATGLVAAGTIYLVKSGKAKQAISLIKGSASSTTANGSFKGLSDEAVVKELSKVNPNLGKNMAYNMNCGNCALTFEARLRGMDVEAMGNPKGLTTEKLGEYLKGLDDNHIKEIKLRNVETVEGFFEKFSIFTLQDSGNLKLRMRGQKIKKQAIASIKESYPNNSRGMLFCPRVDGSHWISWINNNGKVSFYDSQNNFTSKSKELDSLVFSHVIDTEGLTRGTLFKSIRLDDLDFNEKYSNELFRASGSQENVAERLDAYMARGNDFIVNIQDTIMSRGNENSRQMAREQAIEALKAGKDRIS